jgi:hypothetical protein
MIWLCLPNHNFVSPHTCHFSFAILNMPFTIVNNRVRALNRNICNCLPDFFFVRHAPRSVGSTPLFLGQLCRDDRMPESAGPSTVARHLYLRSRNDRAYPGSLSSSCLEQRAPAETSASHAWRLYFLSSDVSVVARTHPADHGAPVVANPMCWVSSITVI